MNIRKSFAVLGFVLAIAIMSPVVRADESNQAMKVTFSQPVQIPGRVLPAGTYLFVLADEITQNQLLRIFNSDRTMLVATVQMIDAQRRNPTDNAVFTFAERGSAQPQVLLTWFYPGRSDGHEFVYSKQDEQQFARNKSQTVRAGD